MRKNNYIHFFRIKLQKSGICAKGLSSKSIDCPHKISIYSINFFAALPA